jgi:tetratricopeptide (TPR) repeat protein
MRHLIACVIGSLCLLAAWAGAGLCQVADKVAPAPQGIAAPPTLSPDIEEMQRQLAKLRAQKELLSVEGALSGSLAPINAGPESQEMAKLRQRVADLMKKVQAKSDPTKAPSLVAPLPDLRPEIGPHAVPEKAPGNAPSEITPEYSAPPDPMGLAQTLFRTGKTDLALKAFRMLKLNGMEPQERLPLQFLIAACLRKLGKTEDAAALFREVANARGDEQIAACAQWELNFLRWKSDFQAQLQQIRDRGKGVEP